MVYYFYPPSTNTEGGRFKGLSCDSHSSLEVKAVTGKVPESELGGLDADHRAQGL